MSTGVLILVTLRIALSQNYFILGLVIIRYYICYLYACQTEPASSDRFIITFFLVALITTTLSHHRYVKLNSVHYFSICVVILFLVQFVRLEFHRSPGTDVLLNISEFLFCHVYFSRPGGRCTCTFTCFIIFGLLPLIAIPFLL